MYLLACVFQDVRHIGLDYEVERGRSIGGGRVLLHSLYRYANGRDDLCSCRDRMTRRLDQRGVAIQRSRSEGRVERRVLEVCFGVCALESVDTLREDRQERRER